MNPRKAVCLLAVLLMSCVPLALAQGTYTQIDYPGGVIFTHCGGITRTGVVVGTYEDYQAVLHGFVLSHGEYTTIDYPGATDTALTAINDVGQAVGFYNFNPTGAFVYDFGTQTFTLITVPETLETIPSGINDSGVVVGWYADLAGHQQGFELRGPTYHRIKVPNTRSPSYPSGITQSGQVVGRFGSLTGSTVNFILEDGVYRGLTIPDAPGAVVESVNPQGNAVVGQYQPTANTEGFVYARGQFQMLQPPGAITTTAQGISGTGQVVGFFIDASGGDHGFLWTP